MIKKLLASIRKSAELQEQIAQTWIELNRKLDVNNNSW